MVRISKLKRDLNDIAEVEYESGIFVSLRHMPNPDYDAFMSKLKKPIVRKIRKGTLSDEEHTLITMEAMANAVVTGWRGIEDDDDQEVPFTPEKCFEYFKDPELYDFYQFCRTESVDIANYAKEDEDDATKN